MSGQVWDQVLNQYACSIHIFLELAGILGVQAFGFFLQYIDDLERQLGHHRWKRDRGGRSNAGWSSGDFVAGQFTFNDSPAKDARLIGQPTDVYTIHIKDLAIGRNEADPFSDR